MMSKKIILLISLFSYLQVHSSYKGGTEESKSCDSITYGSDRRVGRQPHPVSRITASMPVGVLVECRGQSPSGKRIFSDATNSTRMSRCLGNPGFLAQMQQKKSD